MSYWEENRRCNLEVSFLLTILLSVPFNKLPFVWFRRIVERIPIIKGGNWKRTCGNTYNVLWNQRAYQRFTWKERLISNKAFQWVPCNNALAVKLMARAWNSATNLQTTFPKDKSLNRPYLIKNHCEKNCFKIVAVSIF